MNTNMSRNKFKILTIYRNLAEDVSEEIKSINDDTGDHKLGKRQSLFHRECEQMVNTRCSIQCIMKISDYNHNYQYKSFHIISFLLLSKIT